MKQVFTLRLEQTDLALIRQVTAKYPHARQSDIAREALRAGLKAMKRTKTKGRK